MWLEQNNATIKVTKASEEERAWLYDFLSFSDANAHFKKRGKWNRGNDDGRVHMYSMMSGAFPAGLLSLVVKAAPTAGFEVQLFDQRAPVVARDREADLAWLYDYQLAAVDAVERRERGLLWLPTGAGKTEIAVALVRAFPTPWLFLSHRTQLADNAADRYEKRTGLPAGRIGEGQWNVPADAMIITATFQTLGIALEKKDPRAVALVRDSKALMVDETHILPANSFYKLVQKTVSARLRVGLSGTPLARGDRKSPLLIGSIGPVIHRVATELLIERGVLAKPTIHMVEVREKSDAATWAAAYREGVVESKERNGLVIEACRRAEKPSLLFVKDIKHGKSLEKDLLRAGIQAGFVWGSSSVDMRKTRIRDLVAGRLDVLVCSVVFQEGIDIPELRSAVFASAGKSVIATLQRLGRGMRVEKDRAGTVIKNTFEAYDFADRGCCNGKLHKGCKWLNKHTNERLKAYSGEGHTVHQITLMVRGSSKKQGSETTP